MPLKDRVWFLEHWAHAFFFLSLFHFSCFPSVLECSDYETSLAMIQTKPYWGPTVSQTRSKSILPLWLCGSVFLSRCLSSSHHMSCGIDLTAEVRPTASLHSSHSPTWFLASWKLFRGCLRAWRYWSTISWIARIKNKTLQPIYWNLNESFQGPDLYHMSQVKQEHFTAPDTEHPLALSSSFVCRGHSTSFQRQLASNTV